MQIACDVAGNKSNCFQFVGAGSNILPSGMENDKKVWSLKKTTTTTKNKNSTNQSLPTGAAL